MNSKLQNVLLGMLIVTGIVLCAMLFASGKKEGENDDTTKRNTSHISATASIVNMPTTAVDLRTEFGVVTAVNAEAKTISFRLFGKGENYDFRLEEAAYIYSAYDNAMTLSQLDMGDVAYITYDAVQRTLHEIHLTNDAVCHRAVTDISLNNAYRTISFFNKNYEYSQNVVVVSGKELITPEQLSAKDLLTVYEMDKKVVSIVVERGHGYLSLTGVDLFMGGYVDVGGEIIRTINKDMMLLVTEGEYKVSVSHKGYYGYKTVKIERDKVSTVDFSEIVANTVENGNVFFNIDVKGAKLYLNGEETDYSQGVLTLPTGSYSVRVSAEGYENYVDKVEIIADYQKIDIKMTPDEEQETKTQASTTARETSSSTGVTSQYETETATKVSTKNRVYIDGPAGASIYFDGTYIGTAPFDFAMVTGEHTFIVIFGTDVKSYTVNLVEGADDVRYDFTPKSE